MATTAPSAGPARPSGHLLASAALIAALLTAAAVCWLLNVRMWLDMGNGPGTMGFGLAGFIGFWTTMMAAMMLPSATPTATLYLRSVRARAAGPVRLARTAALVCGYLTVWAGSGIAAYFAAWGASRLAISEPGVARWAAAAALVIVGLYQLSPLKDRCLSHCRSPLGFLMHVGNYRGPLRDFKTGAYHGAFCLGCCWSLMAIFIVVGVMNLAWMAALAAVIALEKLWRYGPELSRAVGIALIGLAFFVPWNPSLVPGMYVDPDRPPMMMRMNDR
ncbi:MAG: DUF2182 domain-containing protein [Gaiellaceae bacterium]